MTRANFTLIALFVVAGAIAVPSPARAMSTYYNDKSCYACHGSSTITCNGCHHHGPVSLSAAPNKTTFAPGETITVTLNGGSQSGWFRAAVLDQSNVVLVKKSGTPVTGAFAPSNGATYPVTLTVAAPSTAGTYTWKGAWYGNGYDSGGTIGGAGYIPDPTNGNHGYQPVNFTFTVAAPAPATCSSFTYSSWSTCSTSGTQTRTVLTSSPSGCTGGTPITTQSCTYVPPTCTSWTYSTWGACQPDGTQSRTVLTSSPTSCTGGSPTLTQACTYTAPACAYTYSSWSACSSSGTQTRTVASSSPSGCTGTPVLSQSCTYTAPSCTSFTYSSWGTCSSSNTQTRTVLTSSPAGCTGGTPTLTQACTYVAPTCTSFTYSSWSACSSSSTQTRTVLTSSPTSCTGGTPVTTQSCTYTPPTTTIDGAALYTQYCAGCHGSLSSSSKRGATATQIQTAINNVGAMSSLSFLTSAQVQAIADALKTTTTTPSTCTSFTYSAWSTCSSSGTQTRTVLSSSPSGCTGGSPVTTQSCTYTPPTTTIDGASLYTQYCGGCHGSLSSSSKGGATATQIQSAIKNVGAMSSLSFLTSAQIQAIADALATTSTPPPTTGACGSCHAIPPNTGKHVFHVTSEGVGCSTCHGSGYDGTKQTVNTSTHQDGKIELTRKLRWDTATNSCSPSCHGTKTWTTSGGGTSGGGGGGGHGDDIVIVDDAEPAAVGCSSAGGSVSVLALAGLALLAIVRRRRAHRPV